MVDDMSMDDLIYKIDDLSKEIKFFTSIRDTETDKKDIIEFNIIISKLYDKRTNLIEEYKELEKIELYKYD